MSATTAMIVSCPSCATTYELPPGETPADGAVIRCSACGHSWLEATAREAARPSPAAADALRDAPLRRIHPHLPVPDRTEGTAMSSASAEEVLPSPGLEDEAALLAQQALAAETERRRREKARRRERLRWAALAVFILAVGGGVHGFRHELVTTFPGLAKIYALAGHELRPAGFDIAAVKAERALTLGGDRVLTVEGTLANTTDSPRRAPALRFVLRDARGGALHAWELKAVSARNAPPGRPLQFVTRLADPPAEAVRVEVHVLPES